MLKTCNKGIGLVMNASDSSTDVERRDARERQEMEQLTAWGTDVSRLDLRSYFGRQDALQRRIDDLGALWITGGNVFVLRLAMRLSGLDDILRRMERDDFLYAGYSAAGCVLAPRLECYQIVDDATATPYERQETIWEGLGLLDFALMPHFDSDHPESEDIGREIAHCRQHNIPFKPLRDGEVLILE